MINSKGPPWRGESDPQKNPALEDVDFLWDFCERFIFKNHGKKFDWLVERWNSSLFYTTTKSMFKEYVLWWFNKGQISYIDVLFFLRGPNPCYFDSSSHMDDTMSNPGWSYMPFVHRSLEETCRWPKRGRHEVPCSISSMELVNKSAISQKGRWKGSIDD